MKFFDRQDTEEGKGQGHFVVFSLQDRDQTVDSVTGAPLNPENVPLLERLRKVVDETASQRPIFRRQ